jgi:hypothetical protein
MEQCALLAFLRLRNSTARLLQFRRIDVIVLSSSGRFFFLMFLPSFPGTSDGLQVKIAMTDPF